MTGPPSRFLSLPRELRDSIYGFCTRDVRTKQARVAKEYSGGREIQVQQAPYLSLLLTCRQIFGEYRAVARTNVTLLINDVPTAVIVMHLALQVPVQRITKLELRCLLMCARCHRGQCAGRCKVAREADEHAIFIEQLARQMKYLNSIHITLKVWWPDNDDASHLTIMYPQSSHNFNLSERLAVFSAIEGVTSIEVTRRLTDKTVQPYALWDKEDGWQGSSATNFKVTHNYSQDMKEISASETEA